MANISNPVVVDYLSSHTPTELTNTHAILVFGRNSATYKFALLKTLMSMEPKSTVSYSDIGQPFLEFLVEHYKYCPHQHNRKATQLSDAINDHLNDELDWDRLFNVAEKSIYNNVFDAFHRIGQGELIQTERLFEHDKPSKQIVLTDRVNAIQSDQTKKELIRDQTEVRWRIVEEAWRAGISPNLIYDPDQGTLPPGDENLPLPCSRPSW